jgi:hypothetical protein
MPGKGDLDGVVSLAWKQLKIVYLLRLSFSSSKMGFVAAGCGFAEKSLFMAGTRRLPATSDSRILNPMDTGNYCGLKRTNAGQLFNASVA